TLLAVRSESSCSPGCSFYHSDLARATNYAVANGAKVLNFSLGGNGVDADWQAALTNAVSTDHIVVAAAGNAGGANPIDPAAWLAAATGQGRGLAVGAVGTDGVTMAPFSNQAGTAKDYFLVAPGVNIVSTANGGGTRAVSGTSFSAPAVSGAAAVVWGASPFLTGKQVVDILLGSATDLGDAGVDTTYGHGLLNLNAALQPLGLASIPTGTTVSGGSAALASTSLSLGSAFGDAFSRGGPLSQAMFLDGYGRPFNADLTSTVRTQAKSDPLAAWLGPNKSDVTTTTLAQGTALTLAAPPVLEPQFGVSAQPGEEARQPRFALSTEIGGNRLGMARGFGLDQMTGLAATQPDLAGTSMNGSLLASPYLALSGDGTAMSAGRDLGDGVSLTLGFSQDGGNRSPLEETEPNRKAVLAEATKRFQDGSVLGGQVGTLNEESGPLNSSSQGAFNFDHQADTLFLGFFGATPLTQRITLFGRWGLGMTDGAALRSGLVHDSTDITSQSFALGASARDVGIDGDRLTFTASKPLRVTSGSASLAVPVGRTMDGTVLYRDDRVKLSPSGSETDLELSWSVPVGLRQQLMFGGLVALEPGHEASAPPAFAAGAKYRLTW
ncbi:MAG: S8 family serine peptidase, partial [Rhodospirillaceae bacterium]|nr:S8 family serine peptidase [Rhodospirillales bacterium]